MQIWMKRTITLNLKGQKSGLLRYIKKKTMIQWDHKTKQEMHIEQGNLERSVLHLLKHHTNTC